MAQLRAQVEGATAALLLAKQGVLLWGYKCDEIGASESLAIIEKALSKLQKRDEYE